MHLIVIHIGTHFPDYLGDCLEQLISKTKLRLHLLISDTHISNPCISKVASQITVSPLERLDLEKSISQVNFEKKSRLNKTFRGGFWFYASLRFFYLANYVNKFALQDVFHIENDNLIYIDPADKIDVFREKSMWAVFDSPNRCIPGFMYFKNYQILQLLLEHLTLPHHKNVNDMRCLRTFELQYPELVGALPIISNYSQDIPEFYTQHASKFQCLFDGAALGQYIGGVDPQNIPGDTTGFINEECIFTADKTNIEWNCGAPRLNGYPVMNLHIHSKDLKRWKNRFYTPENIISGEQIQQTCDVYCGLPDDFNFNPIIRGDNTRHLNLLTLNGEWNNPKVIFCYTHRLDLFQEKMHYLANPFILVTHNSDGHITESHRILLDNPKLISIYCQNPSIVHPKINFLPIGIANNMWAHGDKTILCRVANQLNPKTHDIFFNFNVNTNQPARIPCRDIIQSKGLVFRPNTCHEEYLQDLSRHRFAICPPGNGVDSHRIWECYYLDVIPIVVRSVFTDYLEASGYPCIILDTWQEFDQSKVVPEYANLIRKLERKNLKIDKFMHKWSH